MWSFMKYLLNINSFWTRHNFVTLAFMISIFLQAMINPYIIHTRSIKLLWKPKCFGPDTNLYNQEHIGREILIKPLPYSIFSLFQFYLQYDIVLMQRIQTIFYTMKLIYWRTWQKQYRNNKFLSKIILTINNTNWQKTIPWKVKPLFI